MDTRNINVITLAYMGDAVYEVYIRKSLIDKNIALVDDLQKVAINYVSAKSQSKILNLLIDKDVLTLEEMDVVKRGKNYKRASHPKNTDILTYKNSTGFEALIGYLYLNNNKERLDNIMKIVLEESYEKNN
jgi:ribonuclease III